MGLLKDIYDIVLAEPAARKALGQGLEKILKGPGFFGKEPPLQQQLDGLKLLVAKFSDDNFPNSFSSVLDYLGVMMATIVQITHLKKRGCFIKSFYSDRFNFYFPCPANEPKLRKAVSEGDTIRYLEVKGVTAAESIYEFYALEKNDGTPSPDHLQEILERIIRAGEGREIDIFLKEARKSYSRILKFAGIRESKDGRGFGFLCVNPDGAKLGLTFAGRQEIRRSIAADLNAILDFNLV